MPSLRWWREELEQSKRVKYLVHLNKKFQIIFKGPSIPQTPPNEPPKLQLLIANFHAIFSFLLLLGPSLSLWANLRYHIKPSTASLACSSAYASLTAGHKQSSLHAPSTFIPTRWNAFKELLPNSSQKYTPCPGKYEGSLHLSNNKCSLP